VVTRQSRTLYGDFLDLVAFQLRRDFEESALASENLKVFTGLDIRTQQAAVAAMQSQVATLVRQDRRLETLQGAIVVTDPQSGQVKAIVGSTDGHYTGFNRALGAVRPIGSLVKPPLYLLALATGKFTWLSALNDEAMRFDLGGEFWQPENFDRQQHGQVPMYLALAKSYNLATLDLAKRLGFERVGSGLRQLGVQRPFVMRPSVALGALELSPFEVARLYQPLASKGRSAQLGIVAAVMDGQGKIIKRFDDPTTAPFTDAVLATTLDGMTQVGVLGTAQAAQAAFPTLRFAAKTGTTNQQRDSWFVGITANYATTIWLGDDNNKPLSITGGSGAQMVWIELMQRLSPVSLPTTLPKGAHYQQVHPREVTLVADRCDDKITLAFLQGTEPTQSRSCLWPF
jgi:penicillin-binding protein 1B